MVFYYIVYIHSDFCNNSVMVSIHSTKEEAIRQCKDIDEDGCDRYIQELQVDADGLITKTTRIDVE